MNLVPGSVTESVASIENIPELILAAQSSAAERVAARHLAIRPNDAEVLRLLSLVRVQQGEIAQAASLLDQALALRPPPPAWLRDRAALHLAAAQWEEAEICYRAALAGDAGQSSTWFGLATALRRLHRYVEAIDAFRRATALDPDNRSVVAELARTLLLVDDVPAALDLWRTLAKRHGIDAEACRLLGAIAVAARDHTAAREAFQELLRLAPQDLAAHVFLADDAWGLGDVETAIRYGRFVIESGKAPHSFHCFYLYWRLFSASDSPQSLRTAFETFGRAIALPEATSCAAHTHPDPDRRLRVGYLTHEFVSGPPASFLPAVVGSHDPDQIEVYCYHTAGQSDAWTDWYRNRAHWNDCSLMSPAAIADAVRRDSIDILVDLSGIGADIVLAAFAHRPAPVQVAYPNLPCTTGVVSMDYILSDRWLCPEGHEDQYTEQIVRIPSGLIVYAPPEGSPPGTPLPALRNGCITFGLFQRMPKLNPLVLDLVAAVLNAVPQARLLMQNGNRTLDSPDSERRLRLLQEFKVRGISGDRLRIVGARPHLEAMAIMAEADIALDAFPYSGHTTTCECLWMGVPVVTLTGQRHGSRVTTALLERSGLGDLAACTSDEYVRIAATLAGQLDVLGGLRHGLRDRMTRASILDSFRLGRELDQAYRWMWNRWCASVSKEEIPYEQTA